MTVSNDTLVGVRNMMNHKQVLIDKNTRSRYVFGPQQTKTITAGELRSMAYVPGVITMLYDGKLRLQNKELCEEFNIPTDIPEYDMTMDEVDDMLLNKDKDYLLDALDFAPEGILELIKSRAIELKIPDILKRKYISDALGCDIDNMIRTAERFEAASSEAPAEKKTPERKRRVSANKK